MAREDAIAEVEHIMATVDTDGSGYIDYTEFLAATVNKKKLLSSKNLEVAFNAFDRDGSGSISINEIREMLGESILDPSALDEMIGEIDEDGNGEIDMNEFKEMMLKLF